jgi:nucleoside-diphosphate-sugar epimerase
VAEAAKPAAMCCPGCSAGYEILNFDLQPFENTDIFWVIGDVTDSGQVFNAMTMHFGRKGLLAGKPPNPVDAVVHFAAIPRVFIKADNETYRVNVMGTYNVIEAAMKLGIRKVVIASSETTYGVCFAEGDKDFHGFSAARGLRRRPDGQLWPLQGRQRAHGAGLRHALWRGYLRAAYRQRYRAARIQSVSRLRQ